jgi:hypothetical protein
MKSSSRYNNLAKLGHKFGSLNRKELNSMTMLNVETKLPVYSHVFNGAMLDKQAVKEFIEIKEVKGLMMIIDAGFYSEEILKIFSGNCDYIVPLCKNLKVYKKVIKDQKIDGKFSYQVLENKKKKNNLIQYQKIKIENDRFVYIFRDMNESNNLVAS